MERVKGKTAVFQRKHIFSIYFIIAVFLRGATFLKSGDGIVGEQILSLFLFSYIKC